MNKLRAFLNSLSLPEQTLFADRVAQLTGGRTSVRSLRSALAHQKQFGVELCIAIQKASDDAVLPEHLRPDVDWAYLRKPRKRRKTQEKQDLH